MQKYFKSSCSPGSKKTHFETRHLCRDLVILRVCYSKTTLLDQICANQACLTRFMNDDEHLRTQIKVNRLYSVSFSFINSQNLIFFELFRIILNHFDTV